jgi:S-adenosylmethionine:tRNA ribosyltransferase-isomerase
MIAADQAIQRPPDAKLLYIDSHKHFGHVQRSTFAELLRPGDLVIANDAATLPSSLQGVHLETGSPVEVRLAGRPSLRSEDAVRFTAVIFGEGDYTTRTEDRKPPPELKPGDRFALGPLRARVVSLLGHSRLLSLVFDGPPDEVWAGLARHGRPIQYAHLKMPLALWDVWTNIAGPPVAFEPPSAGFILDWRTLAAIRLRGVRFATITHAAGISSTGDEELDSLLPFDEPYRIPERTAAEISQTRASGGRIIAVGTTVVRALEDACSLNGEVRSGDGLATKRLGPTTRLCVVDAILSGTHEPGTSHYELLRAFLDDATLGRTSAELEAGEYRTHEFGDSVFIERVQRLEDK